MGVSSFVNNRQKSVVSLLVFRNSAYNFSILLKFVKTVNNSTLDFVFRDEIGIIDYFDLFFCLKFSLNISKLSLFSSKIAN